MGCRAERSFRVIEEMLNRSSGISIFELQFILQTDTSNDGLGVVLTQKDGNREYVIAYASRRLTKPEKNCSTAEKECSAVIW